MLNLNPIISQRNTENDFLRRLHVPHPHLAHELFPVDLGGTIGLQFDLGCGTGWLGSFWGVFSLVIGPLNPVASKLWQQDEGKGTGTTQNLAQ